MPVVRRRRRNMGRRRRTNRRGMQRRQRRTRRYVQPVPQRFYTKLRYAFTGQQLVLTAGAINRQSWAANGLFDPDVSGAGHQPYYFDQLSAMYRRYQVYGVKIQIWAQSNTGADGKPIYMTLWAQPSGDAVVNNPDQMVELFGSKTTILGAGEQPRYISKYWKCHQIYNVSKRNYNADPNYSALTGNSGFGNNPTSTGIIQCQAFTQGAAGVVNMTTKITYYCVFYQRINNVIS